MHAHWNTPAFELEPYSAPEWAKQLPHVPEHRIEMGQFPTPIHRWNLPGVPEGFEVYIKRDDQTGCAMTGNKVRKLEFSFADAVKQGCKHVITCGGLTSNHCRATAVAAAQVGLKCHLVLATKNTNPEDAPYSGNMFLNRVVGSDMYLVGKSYPDTAMWPPMLHLSRHIRETTGQKSYIIAAGGSDEVGLFGYIEAFNELLQQGILEHVTDLVFASGSGGTAASLAIANHLATKSRIGLHAVQISDGYSTDYLHSHVNSNLQHLGLDVRSEDIINVVEGYVGPGFHKPTQHDLDLVQEVGESTGIILDPTFTAKAARGLLGELKNNPQNFKGNKILFIHTGGLFGAMDDEALLRSMKEHPSSDICTWYDHDGRRCIVGA